MEAQHRSVIYLEERAQSAALLYLDFVGLLKSSVGQAKQFSGSMLTNRKQLAGHLDNLLVRWEEKLLSQMSNDMREIASLSLADARFEIESFNVSSLTEQSVNALTDDIEEITANLFSAKMRGDLSQAKRAYQRHILEVATLTASGVEERHARISSKERELSSIGTYTDSLKRNWGEQRWADTTFKKAYFELYNVSKLYLLTMNGAQEVSIFRPNHPSHQKSLAVGEYQELEDKYFHPNSRAIVINW